MLSVVCICSYSMGRKSTVMQACSAAFAPDNANLLAVGTAACETRLYDIRRLDAPLASAPAARAVSYVSFLGNKVVSSVVNSSLQLLDIQTLVAGEPGSLKREFCDHMNQRHFVGLAVTPAGYIFTGSETNDIVMYHESSPKALNKCELQGQDEVGLGGSKAGEKPIVSCLAVGKSGEYVVAGGTTGWVNVIKLV
jgi:hypothetical protein